MNAKSPETARREASAWLARRDRGLTSREGREYAAWIQADPGNAAAMAALEGVWTALDQLSGLAPGAPDPALLAPAPRFRPVWIGALAAAAAVVLALVVHRPGATAPIRYVANDLVRHVRLEDGSVVDLNAHSEITVSFTAAERRVAIARGEAGFAVAANPARPFIVSAAGVAVRAVGTVFDVRLFGSEVDVLVTEGRVRVTRDFRSAVREDAPLVSSGQLATVAAAAAPEVVDVAPAVAGRLLAWQGEMLVFTDRPIGEIVEEFNRRNPTQLIIGDDAIRSIRLGGSFRVHGVDAFVRLLEMGFGISAEHRDGTIVLRKAH